MRNRLIFRLNSFTSTLYAVTFLIFWLTNYVHPLSVNALHVNNSVDILKTRLKNCLCALSLNGLPFKSRLPYSLQSTRTGKSEHTSSASAIDAIPTADSHCEKIPQCDRRALLKISPVRSPEQTILIRVENPVFNLQKFYFSGEITLYVFP